MTVQRRSYPGRLPIRSLPPRRRQENNLIGSPKILFPKPLTEKDAERRRPHVRHFFFGQVTGPFQPWKGQESAYTTAGAEAPPQKEIWDFFQFIDLHIGRYRFLNDISTHLASFGEAVTIPYHSAHLTRLINLQDYYITVYPEKLVSGLRAGLEENNHPLLLKTIELIHFLGVKQHEISEARMLDNYGQTQGLYKQYYDVIELGSGAGRFGQLLLVYGGGTGYIGRYIGIEKKSSVTTLRIPGWMQVKGDILEFNQVLNDIGVQRLHPNSVVALVQNTTGVILNEKGEHLNSIETLEPLWIQLDQFFHNYPNGTFLLSVYRQQALTSWGMLSYWYTRRLNGWPPDLNMLKKGVFVTETGYCSKWWSNVELEEVWRRLNLYIAQRQQTGIYDILLLRRK